MRAATDRARRTGSLKRRMSRPRKRSVGMPPMYLGMIHALRRVERKVAAALLATSTAMSTAELPMPTTSTRLPANGSAVR